MSYWSREFASDIMLVNLKSAYKWSPAIQF